MGMEPRLAPAARVNGGEWLLKWRDVNGYGGIYEVSENGEVRGNEHNPVWYLAEGRDFHPSTIGKRVFLTRAEAEAALKSANTTQII